MILQEKKSPIINESEPTISKIAEFCIYRQVVYTLSTRLWFLIAI